MFTKLINSADPEDPWPEGREKRQEAFVWKWYHFVLALVIIFPYVAIFVLFGIVGTQDDSTTKKVTRLSIDDRDFQRTNCCSQ